MNFHIVHIDMNNSIAMIYKAVARAGLAAWRRSPSGACIVNLAASSGFVFLWFAVFQRDRIAGEAFADFCFRKGAEGLAGAAQRVHTEQGEL